MPVASAEDLFGSASSFQTKCGNEWPLVLYGAYFDESHEKPGFAIAGYSAAMDTWSNLDCHWQELLKRWNLKYFKASECENGLAEFAQYRDDPTDPKSPLKPHERERLRKAKIEFIDAICERHHVLQGYGAVIVTEDFERIIAEDSVAPIIFSNTPYYLGAQLCLLAAAMLARDVNTRRLENNKIEVRPIFGADEGCGAIAKTVSENFATRNPRSAEVLLLPQYGDGRTDSWLQVADTLAYELRKQLTRSTEDSSADYMRVSLRSLLPAIHRVFRLNCRSLKQIIADHSRDSISIPHLLPEALW